MPEDFEERMLLKEADWVWEEMEDFVRLVQRYRSLYVTALFVSIGWVLGQALGAAAAQKGPADALNDLRGRPDIAAVMCVIPMLNAVFFLLMMEAARQIQSLARYRFLLGCKLGDGKPVWRWELWKTHEEGSIRAWTNPSNVFFGALATLLTAGALVFPLPAVRSSGLLAGFWWTAGGFVLAVLVAIIVAGGKRVKANEVADRLQLSYDGLWPPPPKVGTKRR